MMKVSDDEWKSYWYSYMWAITRFNVIYWRSWDYDWVDDGTMRLYRVNDEN